MMYNGVDNMSDSTSQGISQETSKTGRYLRITLALVTGAALAQGLSRQGITVLYPFIQGEFGLSRAQVGLITSAMGIGFSTVVVLAGWLTDNFGVKRMITISLVCTTAFI
ncbi:MFS transporter, partial [Chloroflexota bacterium]